MATTTNYAWETPDDTDLVKDGAAAIRTLGSSVDTTTKALNPSTTLGDIEYRSATANTNTRLGIGSTGQVLTVASGVPSWATPGGSAQTYTLQNAGGTSLTGADTITVSGLSNLNQIYVRVDAASSVNAGAPMALRLNTDSGNNYLWTGLAVGQAATNWVDYVSAFAGSSNIPIGKTGTDAQTRSIYATLIISGCNATTPKPFNSSGSSSGTANETYILNGSYLGTSTISSVSIVSFGGNFDAGTIYIYGA
jgi:hypothetical protein